MYTDRLAHGLGWYGYGMVWHDMGWDGIWDDDGGGSLGCGISRV